MFLWWRLKQAFCLSPGRLLLRIVYKFMQTDGRTNTPSDERMHEQIKSQFNKGFVSLDVVIWVWKWKTSSIRWFYSSNTFNFNDYHLMPMTLRGGQAIKGTCGRAVLSRMPTFCFCGRVPWLYQYWPGGFMLFVVLCPGTLEGSAGSGSGFKASQKTGQRLKVSSNRLGEAGNRTYAHLVFVAVFLGFTSTGRVGLCFLWFYVQELPKAQPAVVLVLKRLRRQDNGLNLLGYGFFIVP